MANSIIMPKAGMAMEEGVILRWLVKEGDSVKKGDAVAEIETDKATMKVEAETDGTVLKILVAENETVPATRTIAWLGNPGEEIPAESAASGGEPKTEQEEMTSAMKSTAGENAATPPALAGRVKATPAARKIAREKGIDLAKVIPTGTSGEIRTKDLWEVDGKRTPISASEKNDTRMPLTNIQRTTGKRMFQSHSQIPAVTIHTKADVTGLIEVRNRLRETPNGNITINDLLLKATAAALERHPRINSVLDGDDLVYKGAINLNMAVATDNGLLAPVIRNANLLNIGQISRIAAELVQKGKEGRIEAEELEGGTFTISNIGKFGITSFTPIVNQPQAAILGICAIEDGVRPIEGKVLPYKRMGLSLTFDHRIVDGMEAAQFIACLRELLENPSEILT